MNINTVKDSLNKVRQGIKDRQDVEQDLRDVLDWCKRSRDTANTITIDPNKELQQTVENLTSEITLLHGKIFDLEISKDKLASIQRRIKRNRERSWVVKVNPRASVEQLESTMQRMFRKNNTHQQKVAASLTAALCCMSDDVDTEIKLISAVGWIRACCDLLQDNGVDVVGLIKEHLWDKEPTPDITPINWDGEDMKFSVEGDTAWNLLASVGINMPT